MDSLLEALSLTRSRQFLLMVEGECANLVCRHRASGGVISRLEFPPLTESLRDLISATAARFGLRGRALPEGDQEKAMEVSCLGSSRTPTLGYRDMIPRVCPLEALSNQERRDIALCADKGTGAGPSGPAAAVSGLGSPRPPPRSSWTQSPRGPGLDLAASAVGCRCLFRPGRQ